MKALGVMLDSRGSTETSVAHNLKSAEKSVAANFDILFNRALPAHERLEECRKRVVSVVLHGCGSWVWTQALARKIVGWETGVLARIWGARARRGEDMMCFWRRRCVEAREPTRNMVWLPFM